MNAFSNKQAADEMEVAYVTTLSPDEVARMRRFQEEIKVLQAYMNELWTRQESNRSVAALEGAMAATKLSEQ